MAIFKSFCSILESLILKIWIPVSFILLIFTQKIPFEQILKLIDIIIWPFIAYTVLKDFHPNLASLIDQFEKFTGLGFSVQRAKEQQTNLPQDLPEVDALEKRLKEITEQNEELNANKSMFEIFYHFEKTYRLIFKDQLNILIALEQAPMLTDDICLAIYRRSMWNPSYPYSDFMGFLINSYLIIYQADKDGYALSILGQDFLNYLRRNNIPLQKGF